MTLILCLDDRDGLTFNNRRQSRDCAVIYDILHRAAGRMIKMNAYSAKLFPDGANIQISEKFLQDAQAGDICFAENADISSAMNCAQVLIIYRWNRIYPADRKIDQDQMTRWHLRMVEQFTGKSHDLITREVYGCEVE